MNRTIQTLACLILTALFVHATEPIDMDRQRELFIDDHLIAETKGDVGLHLMKPEPKEVIFETDAPWEGNTSGYFSLFQDGDLYRMIYRGWRHDERLKVVHEEVTCYAESKDGIHWTKPNLGLFEWEGSKNNNIVGLGLGTHNFTAFRDDNPASPPETRYKALGRGRGGLLMFQSPDCIHWKLSRDEPVITNGAFDSQNLAFWDADRSEYRAYWRIFTEGETTQENGESSRVRAIRTATSKDFISWENEADLTYYEGTPDEHLYTNAIQKYFRAPHLFIGFPTRFLPKEGDRVEPVFMSSRDGVHFNRWEEAVISEDAPEDRKGNRSNYMTWGILQIPGEPGKISVYATENYYSSTPGRVRRFVYRVDGFVALRGGADGGEVLTKPVRYQGSRLAMNYVVREGGLLTVELLDRSGEVIGNSRPLSGDAVDGEVAWEQVPQLSDGVIRLRLTIRNADVFSIRFW